MNNRRFFYVTHIKIETKRFARPCRRVPLRHKADERGSPTAAYELHELRGQTLGKCYVVYYVSRMERSLCTETCVGRPVVQWTDDLKKIPGVSWMQTILVRMMGLGLRSAVNGDRLFG